MNGRPDDFDDTTRLISGLLDDGLSLDERVRLELRLEGDADARRLYMQMVDQEIEFACLLAPERRQVAGAISAAIEEEGAAVRAGWRRAAWLLAAAAGLALAFVLWPRVIPKELPGVVANAEPRAWSADFENGAAPGWVGEIVTEGLPAGSKFGLRTVDRETGGGVSSQIQLPADWNRGLFALTPRSTLHVTYRRATSAGWLDVFMHTSGGSAQAPENSMFMLRHGQFPGAAGEWQTASIPFSLFVRKVPDPTTGELAFIGGAPRDGEFVLALVFGGSPGFDLVIDRIWLTPDGPATESIQALQ
jgi:hypothetical protein